MASIPTPCGRLTSLTVHLPATLLPWVMVASFAKPVPVG